MRPAALAVVVAACGGTEPTFTGDTGHTGATSMAVGGDGRFVLGGPSTVSMHERNGNQAWSWPEDDAADVEIYDVEIAPDGRIHVVGSFRGELSWGGDVLVPGEGSFDDYFVARLIEDGTVEVARALAARPDLGVGGLAIDSDGNALVVGTFAGAIDLGEHRLEAIQGVGTFAASIAADSSDVLQASLVASGAWAKDVVVDQEGAVYVLVTNGAEDGVDFGDDLYVDGSYGSFMARHMLGAGTAWAKRIFDGGYVIPAVATSLERGVVAAAECVTRFDPEGDNPWERCPEVIVHDLAADLDNGGFVVIGADIDGGSSTGDPTYFYRTVIGFDASGGSVWAYEEEVSQGSSLTVGAADPNGTVLAVAVDGELLVFER